MKRTLKINCVPHDYSTLFCLLNLSFLADRRRFYNRIFLNKLLSGSVDIPSLLAKINFKIPTRYTRNSHFSLFNERVNKPHDEVSQWGSVISPIELCIYIYFMYLLFCYFLQLFLYSTVLSCTILLNYTIIVTWARARLSCWIICKIAVWRINK